MDQGTAVASAVAAQLTLDHWWPPQDSTKKMGVDYLYTNNSMPIFLAKIKNRLASGNPPYYFSFDSTFSNSCLAMTAPQLMNSINSKTT
ncbi:hypothetical protein [Paraburkholderia kururiensis]|uniref:Uncharacterized protein n=1 Tax=Paraburkholderia kururiensis TaxID=984307 RepID=A0ABZ0WDX3_9BURK|nr:hypothetical protein [Paraburkholderia kururiensis]WQD75530.1 hypothetical protein U0042_15305 [Paraburkholderia kururiensis]